MTHFRVLRLSLAFSMALAVALPGLPEAAEDKASKAEQKAAEEQARTDKKAAEEKAKADKKEAEEREKADKKAEKQQRKGQNTKEAKRRAQIENSAKTAVDWYADALRLYESGKYLDARAILLPLEDSARAVEIQERVKLLIADTYFEQGGALNLAEALARYKSYLTFFPGSENAAYAQYQLGRSYFKQLGHPDRDQSFTDQAIFEFEKLIFNYPDSPYAEQAKRDILEAKARRAQHEFEVAEFYWDWKDKMACANRLMDVLRDRPELPQREKALWMCAQSLYDTGRREEGDAYAARLVADYPGSEYASKLNPNSLGEIEKQIKRERKQDKQAERTYRAQRRQEMRRTRQVRKDSGLPGDVPQTWGSAGAPAAASSEPQPVPEAQEPAPAGSKEAKQEAEKARKRAEEASAAAAKAEAEEQERAQKDAEREAARREKEEQEAAKRAEKKAKEEAERAAETPEQKAKREKKEAKAKAEAERREAEEARKAEKKRP